jgi:hypothetical protein
MLFELVSINYGKGGGVQLLKLLRINNPFAIVNPKVK